MYMDKTDTEIERLDRSTLSQSQQIALKQIELAKSGHAASRQFVQYCVDRDLGKTPEKIKVEESPQSLTDIMALVGLKSQRRLGD